VVEETDSGVKERKQKNIEQEHQAKPAGHYLSEFLLTHITGGSAALPPLAGSFFSGIGEGKVNWVKWEMVFVVNPPPPPPPPSVRLEFVFSSVSPFFPRQAFFILTNLHRYQTTTKIALCQWSRLEREPGQQRPKKTRRGRKEEKHHSQRKSTRYSPYLKPQKKTRRSEQETFPVLDWIWKQDAKRRDVWKPVGQARCLVVKRQGFF